MDKGHTRMEKRYKIGVICFDLQNFTADFLNRLQKETKGFADIIAYPIIDNIGDIELNFNYHKGENVNRHRVKTYHKNDKHTPEGILLTPNYLNAIKCATKSDIIIHYGIHSSTALISGVIGWMLRKKQISVNQTLPVYWEIKRKWWIRWNKKIFFKFCRFHIAQSRVSIKNLTKVYKLEIEKIAYIPFEAGIHTFKKKYDIIKNLNNKVTYFNEDKITFLFVGNLLRFKGVILSIDAIHYLKNNGLLFNLLIVGPESIASSEPRISELEDYVQKLGLEKQVKILGSKSLSELASLYKQSDVFILPTMKDCFPKVMVEAGIAGKPMITSDACGAVETILLDNLNGYVFKAGSVESLANAMEKISNRKLINEMSLETKKIIDSYLIETRNEAQLYSEVIYKVAKGKL
jgi:glycosyltransferase involved in cell wall biosynthesis